MMQSGQASKEGSKLTLPECRHCQVPSHAFQWNPRHSPVMSLFWTHHWNEAPSQESQQAGPPWKTGKSQSLRAHLICHDLGVGENTRGADSDRFLSPKHMAPSAVGFKRKTLWKTWIYSDINTASFYVFPNTIFWITLSELHFFPPHCFGAPGCLVS